MLCFVLDGPQIGLVFERSELEEGRIAPRGFPGRELSGHFLEVGGAQAGVRGTGQLSLVETPRGNRLLQVIVLQCGVFILSNKTTSQIRFGHAVVVGLLAVQLRLSVQRLLWVRQVITFFSHGGLA